MYGFIIINFKKSEISLRIMVINHGDKTRINHFLFMDDLKLLERSNDQIDSLVNTVYTLSEDIGMEFGIKKCGVLVLK